MKENLYKNERLEKILLNQKGSSFENDFKYSFFLSVSLLVYIWSL